MKKRLNLLIFLTVVSAIFVGKVFATGITVTVDKNYTIDTLDKTSVSETHTIENQGTTGWISDSNTEYFFVSVTTGDADSLNKTLATVQITEDGTKVNFTTDIKTDYAMLGAKLTKAVKPGEKTVFQITYNDFGLIEQKGALADFYAPGFQEGTTTNLLQTTYVYNTYVSVNNTLPGLNFVVPDATETQNTKTYTKFFFTYKSLLNQYIWIQIGRQQYYKFSIIQDVTGTESSNTGYTNEYKLIVPRSVDEPSIYQRVYYSSITPAPKYAETDIDGNLILAFDFPTNYTGQISIQGYAEVGRNNSVTIDASNSGNITDNTISNMGNYLKQAAYWEVNDSKIQTTAHQVIGNERNIFNISKDLYTFIVNRIDYSTVKRFGLNERQGALATLNGGAAVCMEYSDLFLALARADGLPARAVFGYSYDSKLKNTDQEAHQWDEVFMPGLGKWVSIDVTWGESGMKMTEGNLNHFFTHMASVDPNTPALVERQSYGTNVNSLSMPVFTISAINSISDSGGLKTQQMLLDAYVKITPPESSLFSSIQNLPVIKSINVSTIIIVVGTVLMLISVSGIVRLMKSDNE